MQVLAGPMIDPKDRNSISNGYYALLPAPSGHVGQELPTCLSG
jgi:hypothetical protein